MYNTKDQAWKKFMVSLHCLRRYFIAYFAAMNGEVTYMAVTSINEKVFVVPVNSKRYITLHTAPKMVPLYIAP